MQLQENILLRQIEARPSAAIGHIKLLVSNVSYATDFFIKLGLRYIHQSEDVAVLELRGGTHLVLIETTKYIIAAGATAHFDLMVDDIVFTRKCYIQLGLFPSEIQTDKLHSYFIISGPDGYSIKIISSHIAGRFV
ncbi:glyoxalase/bleomycin resistance protein/dioxygenase [Calothrix sp. NIES-4101]|nr:glyoxalase/bleomycin resistance protein/dioxygenase [Calothrix sp. NIES-4101]